MLKKQSILVKLLIMVVPLIILAVFLAVFSGVNELNTLNEAREVYFEELSGIIDDVLACDRDFYQAQLGSDRAHLMEEKGDEAAVKEYLDDFDGNRTQVYDGLDSIESKCVNDPYLYNTFRMTDQTDSVAAIISNAKTLVAAWDSVYDPHTHTGDYDSQYSSFLEVNSLISPATSLDLAITSSKFPSSFAFLNDLDNLFFSDLKEFNFLSPSLHKVSYSITFSTFSVLLNLFFSESMIISGFSLNNFISNTFCPH